MAVVFVYVLVLAAFGASRLFAPREPTSIVEMSSGFVCERGRWAIPCDGSSWANLYVVQPYAPFLMRNVASGSASDTDGGFDCADALVRHREPAPPPG